MIEIYEELIAKTPAWTPEMASASAESSIGPSTIIFSP